MDDSSKNSSSKTQNTDEKIYAGIGEEVIVKHFTYRVNHIKYYKSIESNFSRTVADGIFLIVDLSLLNNDNVSHTVDNNMFKVTDEEGVQFEHSSEGSLALEMSGNESLFLKQCNPKITKRGFLVFEVPRLDDYYLHVSGGFWTGETAEIKLSEK